MRTRPWVVLLAAFVAPWALAQAPYHSPYQLKFSQAQLTDDFDQPPRKSPDQESEMPRERWYQRSAFSKSQAAWGPRARSFARPSPHPIAWQQERVIAVGARYLGYPYQHHHIPDWDPSPVAGWPWIKVALGHNSKGLDCSNFTSWCYNYGLGLRLSSNVHTQAEEKFTRLDSPDALEPGDLLYIRPNPRAFPGQVSHVILWLGRVGVSPDPTPLVMDCHGGGVKDCNGVEIPGGVAIRPFAANGWYAREFDHALRIIR